MNTRTVSVPEFLTLGNRVRFRDEVIRQLDEGASEVLLDLGRTRYVDATGLGVMVSLLNLASERRARIALLNPPSRVEEILEITGLREMFCVRFTRIAA